jgi:hypothetical protein
MEHYMATRGGDDTLKLWDLRVFKKPVHVAEDLYSRYAWYVDFYVVFNSLLGGLQKL